MPVSRISGSVTNRRSGIDPDGGNTAPDRPGLLRVDHTFPVDGLTEHIDDPAEDRVARGDAYRIIAGDRDSVILKVQRRAQSDTPGDVIFQMFHDLEGDLLPDKIIRVDSLIEVGHTPAFRELDVDDRALDGDDAACVV